MPDKTIPDSGGSARMLPDRLRRQLDQVGSQLTSSSDQSSGSRKRPTSRSNPRSSLQQGADSTSAAEGRALRAVFREFGGVYRQYRRRTGAAVYPPLRAAAIAFRREPSFGSLLPVAALMDELALLEW
ncbi:MAG: hypothetical protein ACRENB_12045 [Gemmatimonadales bacterium]